MKLVTRKICALFLAAIMLLQFVFTIPVDVFADAGEGDGGKVVKTILLLRENGEEAKVSHIGENLILQIEWSHVSEGETLIEETVIRLPEELIIDAGSMDISDEHGVPAGQAVLKDNEIRVIIDSSFDGSNGLIKVPIKIGSIAAGSHTLQFIVNDAVVTADIIIEDENSLTEESDISDAESDEDVGLHIEDQLETPLIDAPLGDIAPEYEENNMEATMTSEIDLNQFNFNSIYFLDNDYNPELHDIEDFIYSVDKPYDLNIPGNYGLLYFDFSLVDGHDVKAGDTFTFKLPEELKPVSGIKGELGAIGEWFVEMDGTVRFEFSEGVNGDDVEGYFWFSVRLDEDEMDDTIIQEISFTVHPDFEMKFPVKPKGGSILSKNGTINNNGYNSSEAYWSVDINTSLDKLIDASVSDVIPSHMKLKEGSLKVYRLDVTSGGVRTEDEILEEGGQYSVSIDENGHPTVSFNGLTDEEKSKAYRIKYTTDIIEPDAGFDGTQSFKNNVVLNNDGKNYTSASTVSSGYGKALDKLSPNYDSVRQEFDWIINYNFNEKYIDSSEAFITDTWTVRNNGDMVLQLGEFEIYPVTMNESGKAVVSNTPIDSSVYDLVESSTGFRVDFRNDIDRKAYQIRYTTRLLGSQGTGVVDTSGSVANKVETGTGKEDGSSGSWSQRGVIKSTTGTNVKDKEIGWSILLNQNSYLMENLVVTDRFTGDGLTLMENTVLIKGAKGKTYVLGTDYTLDYTAPVFGTSSGGFVISFNHPVNEPLTLTYTTHFERNSDGTAAYANKAKIDWTEGDKEYKSESGLITVKPAGHTGPNGVKNGNYNAKDKEITWSIHTNYARLPMETGYKIADTIPVHQELVEGSLDVFSYNVDQNGEITGEALLEVGTYSIVYPQEGNGNQLQIEFLAPHIGERTSVGIRFRTKFLNDWIRDPKVENTAVFTNGGKSFNLDATVTIPYGGEYVHKSGIQKGTYNERVDWTVFINRSQSLIKKYTLKDNPDLNSVLLEDSFKVYKTVVQTNGSITKSAEILEKGTDYDLVINTDNETGRQDFVLSFLYDIESPYILEYSSYIDPLVGKGEAITNAYTAEGMTSEEVSDGDISSEVKNVNSGGAGGSSIRGGLIIRKTDERNPGTLLEGAVFNLYTKDGKQLLRTGITDSDGKVKFGGLRRGEYLLREIKAPEGYVISSSLAEGVMVTLSHESQDENREITYNNALTKMNLRKVDEQGSLIIGEAVFDLFKNDGTLIRQNLKTVNGLLSVEDLEEGRYYVQETRSPSGYILNPEKMNFEIKVNEDGTQNIPTVNVVNYKGNAEFVKVNRQGNPVSGAVFHLYRGEDRLRTDLISDSNGTVKIANLAPGTYQVREVFAPAGYLLNTEELQFTIPQSVQGKPQVFALRQFVNYQGIVRLYKADDKGNPLEGAQFKIVDDKNQNVTTGLITGEDGRLYASGLAPGKYRFIETKAPAGYILDPTPIHFEIMSGAEGEPVVVAAGHKENYKGSVVLTKTDEKDILLSGAVFELYEIISDNHVERILIGTFTTNPMGEIFVDELSPGNYEFSEKTAPAGYIVNTRPIAFEIGSETIGKPERVNAGIAVNYKGSAVMVKTDEDGSPLSGAIFELLNHEGETIRTGLMSDDEGRVKVIDLEPGQYSFKEVTPADGYILNDEKLSFVIEVESEGKPQMVDAGSYVNYKGHVELNKTDIEGYPLEDAIFSLYAENDEVVAENLKSDEHGRIFADELSPGNYYFQEESAPEGYIRNTEKISFTIADRAEGRPELISLEAVNYKGSVKLVKISSSGNKLVGAEFTLKNRETGEVLEEGLSTDENGEIVIYGLAPGEYTFSEIKAPSGYIKNLEPVHFIIDIENEGEPEIKRADDFINYKGAAVLVKTDVNGYPLEGAVFEVLDEEGNSVLTDLRSDKEGKVTALELSPGKYRFVEKKAPLGYLLNLEMKTFEISKEAYGEPLFVDAGKLINYKGNAVLIKKDESGNTVKDAVFQVTDKNGTVVKEGLYSGDDGRVYAYGLTPGEYFFEEVEAPAGFIRNGLKASFTIIDEYQGEPETSDAGSLENYRGSAEWFKVNVKGEVLAGAHFNVTDEEGNTVYEDLTSDETGKVLIEGLAPGEYTVTETKSPDGYIRNLDAMRFTIIDVEEGKPQTVAAGNFINYQGSVILTKTDAMGLPLEGAVFELRQDGENKGQWTADEKGLIFIEHLSPGEYSLVEVKSPEGYILDESSYDFIISDAEHGEPVTVQAGHAKNHKGTMVLLKTDERGKPLEGAHFEIRDAENNLIGKAVSDAEGIVEVSNLHPGNYTIRETIAPVGYIINTKVMSFNIEAQTLGKPENTDLGIFVNFKGVLEVVKVDGKGNPLKDAEFIILDDEGIIYRDKLVSEENGQILVSGIAPGKYTLVEVKAPKGYFESDETYPFEIAADYEGTPSQITITVVNEKMPEIELVESLPKAGDKNSGIYFSILGLMFIAAGLTYLSRQKRKSVVQ